MKKSKKELLQQDITFEVLADWQREKGLSDVETMQQLEVDKGTWSKWKSGKVAISKGWQQAIRFSLILNK